MQRFPSFHRNSSSTGVRTAREHLCDILNKHYTALAAVGTSGHNQKQSQKRPERRTERVEEKVEKDSGRRNSQKEAKG
jgi:hypothetical protein